MSNIVQFPWQQEFVICHSQRLLKSFQYWLGRSLFDIEGSPEEIAKALFNAPFVLVSHGSETDPIFNYGNCKALELWELSWDEFTRMPSRKTVASVEQQERDRLLADAATKGFVTNYAGIRTSSSGKRFQIKDVLLWNVLDENHQKCGQAATFSSYEFVNNQ